MTSGDVGCGNSELHYYYSMRPSGSRKPTRWEMILPSIEMGEHIERQVSDVLAAANSFLEEIEEDSEALSIEYGLPAVITEGEVIVGGFRVDPRDAAHGRDALRGGKVDVMWSGFITGLRFPDDPHPYTAMSAVGTLDLIKHDPATGKEIERTSIRSRETLSTSNAGEISILRRTNDLQTFRTGLTKLRDFLQDTPDETVGVMPVPRGVMRENMEKVYGSALENWGYWEVPE